MADFEPAIAIVLQNEGDKFTNDPRDAGHATKYGITIATLKRYSPIADVRELEAMNCESAKIIYRTLYWGAAPFDRLSSQEVANALFDASVNQGLNQAVRALQRACMAVTGHYKVLLEDGVLGIKTIDLVNSLDSDKSLIAMRSERAAEYRAIVARNPMDIVWLNGWLARAYRG